MQTSEKLLISLYASFCALPFAHADTLAAISKFETCLQRAALDLDDLTSPASDIATAAAEQCAPSWQAVLLANGEALSKMDEYPSKAVREASMKNVLKMRREIAKRKNNPSPTPAKPATATAI